MAVLSQPFIFQSLLYQKLGLRPSSLQLISPCLANNPNTIYSTLSKAGSFLTVVRLLVKTKTQHQNRQHYAIKTK